ncbi:FAD-dependent oxidoreductase [Tunicatimonas pelagia]|uniref:FAD-dependent oxidoreductase n=1 Tax=Tunicatimonas pelagia TaxID=931531 RepID=UPI00266703BD|nr:FAD-dependent oxidoreductase [Tunicatimonas pelagia]WKN40938.1 FAD-dependent oxidoreductase [Tunicatimonas pelagia]
MDKITAFISTTRLAKLWHMLLLIAFLLLQVTKLLAQDIQTDICILSGSEAGFTAAIQAARMGKTVALIEPTGHPGGMMVEGIAKDIRFGSSVVIGGITRELYTAIEDYYGREPAFDQYGWHSRYEPSVAGQIIEQFLAQEKNIRIIRNTRIKEENGVRKQGSVIQSITLENGQEVAAKIFIDASVEGHLLHLAGITTETIREGNQVYDETKNGIQVENTYRQFEIDIDPYVVPGDSSSGLLPTIQADALGEYGEPSKYIQGFCFRLVLTRQQDNRIPITKPANYDPFTYEIYRRYLRKGGTLFYPRANRPNGKTDLGSWHDLSANLYGENWRYPTGDYATQDSIVQYHKDFTQGLIWFLQNDSAVDESTRKNWAGWGLCQDEFTDNGGWPRRLYIRSARRLVSDYVITEHHTRRANPIRANDPLEDQPVAIAWWPPDTHHARRIVQDGYAYNEGFVFGGDDWHPFDVSWKALVPKAKECTNLITPTCPSSSYVAYGAIRILPTFMILGQSTGCMAAIAVSQQSSVQKINYTTLRNQLLQDKQILTIPENWLDYVESENH